jgi:GntR family transcriptional regulator, vanillate catabolism transcriptional regulator
MSQTGQKVLASLRQMIISGELAPGEQMAEIPLADKFGVSRTPVRLAIRTLEQEGLLSKSAGRGYMVREINEQEIRDGIDVRGVLEGLAAQLLAERGVSRGVKAILRDCLDQGDALFKRGMTGEDDLEVFHEFNTRFHETIIIESGNIAIADALAGNDHLPFASTSSLAFDANQVEAENQRFHLAHLQHHLIVDALCNGQGARAEALMKEHAHAAVNYSDVFGHGISASNMARMITAA